jgi:hypothetical protein
VALAAVTVGAIIATIVITKQDRQRGDKQLAGAQIRHAKEVAEERALADRRLTEQLAHSDAQLADERATQPRNSRKSVSGLMTRSSMARPSRSWLRPQGSRPNLATRPRVEKLVKP